MIPSLSNRLLACCSFVSPGDRVADVGCDHGYLSIYLLQRGIARSVIASDVNPSPLDSARQNAEKYGVGSSITFCLSDGVSAIPRDFDCLVCAGMGADTMISILSAAPWLRDPRYRLVLQCQSKRPELRRWLSDAGYTICRETLAKDGKFVYSIMDVQYTPGPRLSPAETYLSPPLLASGHPLLPEYCRRVSQGLEQTAAGMRRTEDPRLSEYQEILTTLHTWEAAINAQRIGNSGVSGNPGARSMEGKLG